MKDKIIMEKIMEIRKLKRRLKDVENEITRIQNQLKTLPEGVIELKKIGKYEYYYHRVKGKSKYLGKEVPNHLKPLLRKKELRKRLRELEREKKILEWKLETLKHELFNLI